MSIPVIIALVGIFGTLFYSLYADYKNLNKLSKSNRAFYICKVSCTKTYIHKAPHFVVIILLYI